MPSQSPIIKEFELNFELNNESELSGSPLSTAQHKSSPLTLFFNQGLRLTHEPRINPETVSQARL
jgi:hypothetical protein